MKHREGINKFVQEETKPRVFSSLEPNFFCKTKLAGIILRGRRSNVVQMGYLTLYGVQGKLPPLSPQLQI